MCFSVYAMARTAHHIASQVLANRAFASGLMESDSVESVAELTARRRLLGLREQMERHEADSRLDPPGAGTDKPVKKGSE